MRRAVPVLLLTLLFVPALRAEEGEEGAPALVTKAVEYRHGPTVLEGWLARDPSLEGPRPAVLVIHEWWGLGTHPRRKAEVLARLGYVAFALDMYGKGRLTDDPAEAGRWAGPFRGEGRALGRERARAGLDLLRSMEGVDPERVAAIGFCFGGTIALELAWSGAPIRGAVSFHGNPTTPTEEDLPDVKAAVLVCHGADDPLVSADTLRTFEATMRGAQIDWQLVKYGGAVHSFTNPDADAHGIPGVRYDRRTAARAWRHMEDFLAEVLAP